MQGGQLQVENNLIKCQIDVYCDFFALNYYGHKTTGLGKKSNYSFENCNIISYVLA